MITTAPEARRVTTRHPWPLFYHWTASANPLPRRLVRWPGRQHTHAQIEGAPPWLNTGPVEEPFDFCGHMRRLSADLVVRCPTLEHIDVNRLLFGITQARTRRPHGLQARVTPKSNRFTSMCSNVGQRTTRSALSRRTWLQKSNGSSTGPVFSHGGAPSVCAWVCWRPGQRTRRRGSGLADAVQ